jgi:hypothetical protein
MLDATAGNTGAGGMRCNVNTTPRLLAGLMLALRAAPALDVCPITASASTICSGDAVTLSVNNGQASPIQNAFDPLVFNNFIFSAINPATSKRTIWKKTTYNSAYTPLFNDNYNRVHYKI